MSIKKPKYGETMKGRNISRGLTACQSLDLVVAAHRHQVYPLMYIHMKISGHLDIDRLKLAVSQSGRIIPEIFCAYDFRRGGFVDMGYTADDIVKHTEQQPSPPQVDLGRQPQLRILLASGEEGDFVIAVMSHILADGAGFLQYLYLLAAIYNGEQPHGSIRNVRSISLLPGKIRALASTEQTRNNRAVSVPPLRPAGSGSHICCLTSRIPADTMAVIRQRAKQYGATLNDAFMAAYARVIARLQSIDKVALPCPADLRRFYPQADTLTVANMTGSYRRLVIEIPSGCTFDTTLQLVHIEMGLQKSRRRCLAGIRALNAAFHRVPSALLEQIIKATYRLAPVSYTNFGEIDERKLLFRGCTLRECFLTGAYRQPPDFQLTVSTFKNMCTLNCTLIGSAPDIQNGQYILEQVRRELLTWVENR